LRTLTLFFFLAAATRAQDIPALPPLMPMPAHIAMGQGLLKIDASFRVKLTGYTDQRLRRGVSRMLVTLTRRTGILFTSEPTPSAETAALVISCDHADKPLQLNEDESYRFDVTPSAIYLKAAQPVGALHGLETFLQLVAPGPDGFDVPAVSIEDKPRFAWRGLMLDSARHFMPIENVERTLDGMAAVKFNVFHWHLSDNQGFRVESRVFPRLQTVGSGGQFYTQAQVRSIVAYAADRGIRVIPEFDIPGHTTAMLVAYPSLATDPPPVEIDHLFGVFDPAIDPTKPGVYLFLDKFIGEMAQLFPDTYFHIGGDEFNGKVWRESLRVQQFKQAHGFLPTVADPDGNTALHAYFNTRLEAILRKHGKRMEGWDEILAPGLPKDIVIQSWRGQKSLSDAVHRGYQGILSFGWYLDLIQSAQDHYLVDPLDKDAAALTPDEQTRILGGEAAMWTEWVTPETIDSRIWPRAAAIAERLWSPKEIHDVRDMYRRMEAVSRDLEFIGLRHRSWQTLMLQRLAGTGDIENLRTFAEMLEPVKNYDREEFGPATTITPLIHLVDAVPPESQAARNFAADVQAAISSDAQARDRARTQLLSWQRGIDGLPTLLEHNALVSGIEPLRNHARELNRVAIDALDALQSGKKLDKKWRAHSLEVLKASGTTYDALSICTQQSIGLLIDAVSS
jgi:hexosaminidase